MSGGKPVLAINSWMVTMTGLQHEHDTHYPHQINQCFICPSILGHRQPHGRRQSSALMWCLHTLSHTAHCEGHTCQKHDAGDWKHRASRHSGPAGMPPCAAAYQCNQTGQCCQTDQCSKIDQCCHTDPAVEHASVPILCKMGMQCRACPVSVLLNQDAS